MNIENQTKESMQKIDIFCQEHKFNLTIVENQLLTLVCDEAKKTNNENFTELQKHAYNYLISDFLKDRPGCYGDCSYAVGRGYTFAKYLAERVNGVIDGVDQDGYYVINFG